MDKKVSIYYAKDKEEADKVLLFLKANGIEGEKKDLGKGVYHDIYGGNGVYGQDISVREEDQAQAEAVIHAFLAQKEKPEEKKGAGGMILAAFAVVLVVFLIIINSL